MPGRKNMKIEGPRDPLAGHRAKLLRLSLLIKLHWLNEEQDVLVEWRRIPNQLKELANDLGVKEPDSVDEAQSLCNKLDREIRKIDEKSS